MDAANSVTFSRLSKPLAPMMDARSHISSSRTECNENLFRDDLTEVIVELFRNMYADIRASVENEEDVTAAGSTERLVQALRNGLKGIKMASEENWIKYVFVPLRNRVLALPREEAAEARDHITREHTDRLHQLYMLYAVSQLTESIVPSFEARGLRITSSKIHRVWKFVQQAVCYICDRAELTSGEYWGLPPSASVPTMTDTPRRFISRMIDEGLMRFGTLFTTEPIGSTGGRRIEGESDEAASLVTKSPPAAAQAPDATTKSGLRLLTETRERDPLLTISKKERTSVMHTPDGKTKVDDADASNSSGSENTSSDTSDTEVQSKTKQVPEAAGTDKLKAEIRSRVTVSAAAKKDNASTLSKHTTTSKVTTTKKGATSSSSVVGPKTQIPAPTPAPAPAPVPAPTGEEDDGDQFSKLDVDMYDGSASSAPPTAPLLPSSSPRIGTQNSMAAPNVVMVAATQERLAALGCVQAEGTAPLSSGALVGALSGAVGAPAVMISNGCDEKKSTMAPVSNLKMGASVHTGTRRTATAATAASKSQSVLQRNAKGRVHLSDDIKSGSFVIDETSMLDGGALFKRS